MKNYILGVVLSLAISITPAIAQAQATGLTGAQISSIISLLQAFGADQSVINSVQIALNGSTPTTGGGFCHTFNTNLTVGSSGADVAALVSTFWMAGSESYGDGTNPNMVFTENTAAGVVQFQAKYGIQQTGYVGPITRAKLNSLYVCKTLPPVQVASLSASPISGVAPLVVTFTTNAQIPGPFMMDGGAYKIVFGDGQEQTLHCSAQVLSGGLTSMAVPSSCRPDSVSHTYTSDGNYVASLVSYGWYTTQGATNSSAVSQVTITVNKGSTVAPVISGVSGPTSLQAGQQGTWTVKASDPNNGTLNYSVVWGDETNQMGTGSMSGVPASAQTQQTTTFTHTYSTAGNYRPTFFVTNVSEGSAQTSVSVNVGGATSQSITILSPNGGETWTRGTTQAITWQDNSPLPQCATTGFQQCMLARAPYDIQLARYYAPCTSSAFCTVGATQAMTIATGVYGLAYNWSVGNVLNTYGSNTASDGPYTIQVCQTGTSICHSSDSYFKIVSTGTAQILNISSLSPASGPVGGSADVNGTGFAQGDTVYFNGYAIPTNIISGVTPLTLAFTVPSTLGGCPASVNGSITCQSVGLVVTLGTYNIQIIRNNGMSNEVKSNVVPFTVTQGLWL